MTRYFRIRNWMGQIGQMKDVTAICLVFKKI